MTATAVEQRLGPGFCQHCECPRGNYTCDACLEDNGRADLRRIIDRWSYTRGLTNAEKQLLDDLVVELEAGH